MAIYMTIIKTNIKKLNPLTSKCKKIIKKDNQLWEEIINKQNSKAGKIKKVLIQLFKKMKALKEVYINSWKLLLKKVSKQVDDKSIDQERDCYK